MKKKVLFLSLLFVAFVASAQFSVVDASSNPILDGDVVEYNVLTFPEASLDFFVINNSTTDVINMKIEFVSATNADGSQMELCFGLCYTGINIGQSYPPNADFIAINPGEQTGQGNHMYNADPGNGVDPIDYVFRFYQIDNAGNEIGTPLSMTYRYNPILGVNDVNALNLEISSTIVTDNLMISTDEDLALTAYDLQGRVVMTQNIVAGQNQVDMSNLKSQLYILQFTNNESVSQTAKIIVK